MLDKLLLLLLKYVLLLRFLKGFMEELPRLPIIAASSGLSRTHLIAPSSASDDAILTVVPSLTLPTSSVGLISIPLVPVGPKISLWFSIAVVIGIASTLLFSCYYDEKNNY